MVICTVLRYVLQVKGRVGVADPLRVCEDVLNPEHIRGRVAIVERGDCMFVEKVRAMYFRNRGSHIQNASEKR